MVIGVEEVVEVHVVDQLQEHGSLQHLTQDGQDGNRSVVLWFKLTTFSFI